MSSPPAGNPHDIVTETLAFTRELRGRLRASGESKSGLVERLLREHFGMPPRPDVQTRGRFAPGENSRTRRKATPTG